MLFLCLDSSVALHYLHRRPDIVRNKFAGHCRRFGIESLAREFLTADGVHDLGNLLSLESHVREHFGCSLKVPTRCVICESTRDTNLIVTQSNHYIACVSGRSTRSISADLDTFGLMVTFSSNSKSTRLPNPQLLVLHVVCARDVHMSGAAEAFDELGCDTEDTRLLAFGGSSARLPLILGYRPRPACGRAEESVNSGGRMRNQDLRIPSSTTSYTSYARSTVIHHSTTRFSVCLNISLGRTPRPW